MLTPVTPYLEDALRSKLPTQTFRKASAQYLEEPRGRYAGQAGLVLAPANVDEVSLIVRACSDASIGIVPYSGGTGLVGGQIAPHGPTPIILSLERMAKIREVYTEENIMIAEAGVILADVQKAATDVDRLFPLSLAAEGSARIGGNLATNAGGVNVLRYGNARDLCLGVEAVLPNGDIWNGLTRLRKDNAGYDLRNLLIGSEGTLGIITAAALKLAPVPAGIGTAVMTVAGPQAALTLLSLARGHVGDCVSAFELIHKQGQLFLAEHLPQVRLPFSEPPEWMVLIEVGLSRGMAPSAALEGIFEDASEAGLVLDGIIAQSDQQRADLWAVRENIPEANRRVGSISSHDISVPLGAIPAFIEQAELSLAQLGTFRINCFGHVGDGNLHYNVFPIPGETRADHEVRRPEIKRIVHDLTHEMGGSVAAEHGVGRLKVDDVERYSDPALLVAMRALKVALDPKGIMNPGVILRA